MKVRMYTRYEYIPEFKGGPCVSLTTKLQCADACVSDSRSPSRGCNAVMCSKCILNTGPGMKGSGEHLIKL